MPFSSADVRDNLREQQGLAVGGGLVSVVVAVLLYTRFSLQGVLNRDESIYAYAGQQLANHGTPPYASIFDPKSPGASFLAALGVGLAKLVGRSQLSGVRVVFFLCSVLTVLAVYVLAVQVWRSVAGGIAAAVVFASFYRFAGDALPGPDAKTPGVLLVVVAMWFAVRRQWFTSAVIGSCAFLVWQPFAGYPIVTIVLALFLADRGTARARADAAPNTAAGGAAAGTGSRWHWGQFWKAILGAVLPVAIVSIYFLAAGAFKKFVEAAFVFPLTGAVPPGHKTFVQHVKLILNTIVNQYHVSGVLLFVGYGLLLLLVVEVFIRRGRDVGGAFADPVVAVVAITGLIQIAYALYDFQGAPDVFALLPAGALGFAGAVAKLLGVLSNGAVRATAIIAVLAAAAVLVGFSWVWFGDDGPDNRGLRNELAEACAVQRITSAQHPVWAMGDPIPLVLTGRTNPDRYVYLGEGVDLWKINHTKGGFDAWMQSITTSKPWLVVINNWKSKTEIRSIKYLKGRGFKVRWLGNTRVLSPPKGRQQAVKAGVRLTRHPTRFASGTEGKLLPAGNCKLKK